MDSAWLASYTLSILLGLYSLYWAVTIIAGGLEVYGGSDRRDAPLKTGIPLPKITVLVAVKNEENVVERLVKALDSLKYPRDKLEVVFAEDGSKDKTLEKLRELSETRPWMRVLHFERAGSKAAALNKALPRCSGDIVYVIDADTVPDPESLLKIAAAYARGEKAVAGYYRILNAGESLVPNMVVFEELLWRIMCKGREKLGQPCPLPGFNFAIEKRLLEQLGGFKEGVLAEDAELTLRLVVSGVKPSHFDGYVLVTAPPKLGSFFKQRIRWYRGYLDAVSSNIKSALRARLRRDVLDALLLFLSPLFAFLGLVNTVLAAFTILASYPFLAAASLIGLAVGVGALWWAMKALGGYYEREARKAPLVIVYGFLLGLAASAAVLKHLFRSKKEWYRARHSTYVSADRLADTTAQTHLS